MQWMSNGMNEGISGRMILPVPRANLSGQGTQRHWSYCPAGLINYLVPFPGGEGPRCILRHIPWLGGATKAPTTQSTHCLTSKFIFSRLQKGSRTHHPHYSSRELSPWASEVERDS